LVRAPSFWWQEPATATALLSPVAAAYGAVAAARLRQSGERAGVLPPTVRLPTHSTGTPARSRGYGGRLAGPVRVDPRHHRADDVGDEPLLLAHCAPTIVARDRVAGARFARGAGASAIVLDDGFQNPSLAKDLSILAVDARRALAGLAERSSALPVALKLEDEERFHRFILAAVAAARD